MLKHFVLFIFAVFLVFSTDCNSQESKEKQQSFQDEFDTFAKGQQQRFNQFVTQQDTEFLQMLKENWAEFSQMQPLVRDAEPKPQNAPVKKVQASQHKAQLLKKVLSVPPIKNNTKTSREFSNNSTNQGVSVSFYGHQLLLPAPVRISVKEINQQGLTDYWQQMSAQDFSEITSALIDVKKQLDLSDWAYWLLVNQYSQQYYVNEQDALALTWFLLNKTGYKASIAFTGERGGSNLVLLMPAKQTAYSVAYYKINGERYYQFAGKSGQTITTYKGYFSSNNNALNLSFDKTLVTKPSIRFRTVSFQNAFDAQSNEQAKSYKLKLPYDYQRVRYFSIYPQLDLRYYFQAPVDKITQQAMYQQIQPLIKNSADGNINQILSFIHQAFPYAVDEQQFGKENYLMIEETLHYQASDCEDRAILFSWLAKNLLNESVVALNYPGHVSTAIARGDKLLSADPTYIGASLGDVMTDYRDIQPEVIRY